MALKLAKLEDGIERVSAIIDKVIGEQYSESRALTTMGAIIVICVKPVQGFNTCYEELLGPFRKTICSKSCASAAINLYY